MSDKYTIFMDDVDEEFHIDVNVDTKFSKEDRDRLIDDLSDLFLPPPKEMVPEDDYPDEYSPTYKNRDPVIFWYYGKRLRGTINTNSWPINHTNRGDQYQIISGGTNFYIFESEIETLLYH